MSDIKVPVSIGELLDKITILRIKQEKIEDQAKVANVTNELDSLLGVCQSAGIDVGHGFVSELEKVNRQLWQIEDDIRDKERAQDFGDGFVDLARSVYRCNDERFAVKSKINREFGSRFHEEKSYKEY